jgi:hypothetical protein
MFLSVNEYNSRLVPASRSRRQGGKSALRQLAIGLLAAGLMILPAAAAEQAPDATIELSGGAVAAGIGYSWGKGILDYQGKQYKLKVSGLSIADVGASEYTASGSVYNLHNVRDIEGTYTAAEAGATVAGGASATAMQNAKGVIIRMTATRQGLQFTLAAKGVTIKLSN